MIHTRGHASTLLGGLSEAGPAGSGRRLQWSVLINHAVLKVSQLSTQPRMPPRARCANEMGFSADGGGMKDRSKL